MCAQVAAEGKEGCVSVARGVLRVACCGCGNEMCGRKYVGGCFCMCVKVAVCVCVKVAV